MRGGAPRPPVMLDSASAVAFPDPRLYDETGLVAVGGDLSSNRRIDFETDRVVVLSGRCVVVLHIDEIQTILSNLLQLSTKLALRLRSPVHKRRVKGPVDIDCTVKRCLIWPFAFNQPGRIDVPAPGKLILLG